MTEQPICATCMEVHGRDTNSPIECGVCGIIVGCFWHRKDMLHIRNCERAKRGQPPIVPWPDDETSQVSIDLT
jgi:hypothetical protein